MLATLAALLSPLKWLTSRKVESESKRAPIALRQDLAGPLGRSGEWQRITAYLSAAIDRADAVARLDARARMEIDAVEFALESIIADCRGLMIIDRPSRQLLPSPPAGAFVSPSAMAA